MPGCRPSWPGPVMAACDSEALSPVKNGSGWAEQAGRLLGLDSRAPSVRWQQGTIHWRLAAQISLGREGAGLLLPFSEIFLHLGALLMPSPKVFITRVAFHVIQEIGC